MTPAPADKRWLNNLEAKLALDSGEKSPMDTHIERAPQMLARAGVKLTAEQQAAFIEALRHDYEMYPRTPLRNRRVVIHIRSDGTLIDNSTYPGCQVNRTTQGNTGLCTYYPRKHSTAWEAQEVSKVVETPAKAETEAMAEPAAHHVSVAQTMLRMWELDSPETTVADLQVNEFDPRISDEEFYDSLELASVAQSESNKAGRALRALRKTNKARPVTLHTCKHCEAGLPAVAKLQWLDTDRNLLFLCPGCKCTHYVRVQGPGPIWEWNGNWTKPTFAPDIVFSAHLQEKRCHFSITDGLIHFYEDCHHALAFASTTLPDWPE